MFTEDIIFSLLMREIRAFAFPISSTAVNAAVCTSSLLIRSPFSTIAVRGARASRTKVCIFARSLSKDLVACEISDLRNKSTAGVFVATTFGRGYLLRVRFLASFGTLRVHEIVRSSLVSSETSISAVLSSSSEGSAASSASILSLHDKLELPALRGVCRLFELLVLEAERLLRIGLLDLVLDRERRGLSSRRDLRSRLRLSTSSLRASTLSFISAIAEQIC